MLKIFPYALAVSLLCSTSVWGQQDRREAKIGYLYPAGARQGTVVRIFVGGQRLNNVKELHVTGEGVSATIVRFMGGLVNLNGDERRELLRQLSELTSDAAKEFIEKHKTEIPNVEKPKAPAKESVTLPKHPLLNSLDQLSVMELEFLIREILIPDNKKQPNTQIGETVLIEVTVAADAPLGDRELRLLTPLGLTNPLCLQVGALPEIREEEPLNARPPQTRNPERQRKGRQRETVDPEKSETPTADLPATLNGQIKPGDIDIFRFRATEGQRLVIDAHARRLIPFLADAVPGWFQAVLTLYDETGREVAFADDDNFNPDPVLFFQVPKTGIYELEIRDALYRGRLDFVYRIDVGELPFVRSIFPLGGREGTETTVTIDGWNLQKKQITIDTAPGVDRIRETAPRQGERIANRIAYAVDTLPECIETETNDSPKDAQPIVLPTIVNGRMGTPGDTDVFRFNGKAGDEVAIEVVARRLGSPLDSLLRLSDDAGNALAWNDDVERKEGHLYEDPGAITHHADSSLRVRLPKDGTYYAHLTDTQHHGGGDYSYRLRVGPPRPDFTLCVTPSGMNTRAGLAAPITVYASREDGFDGDIVLSLKDAPAGFALQGGVIPAGRNSVRATLTASPERLNRPISLCLEGSAQIGSATVRRRALPADDVMQAFLYRHLLPSRELVVVVTGGGGRVSPSEIVGETPVRIPAGGAVDVMIKPSKGAKIENLQFKLLEPPPGVSIRETNATPEGLLKLTLTAETGAAKVGDAGNLIVEVIAETEVRPKGEKGPVKKNRFSAGILPAIPFKIVQQNDK